MNMTIDELQERLEVARLEHEETQLKAETALIEGAVFPGMHVPTPRPLQEAWGDTVPQTDYPSGERDRVWGMGGRGGYSVGAELGDRQHGQNRVAFEDESALAHIRATGRYLADCTANGQAVLENLTSYILGTGYGYKVVGEDGEKVNDTLITDVQSVVNEFIRDNAWLLAREEELFRRAHRDGEYFVALYHGGDGRVSARVLEPEQFMEPNDKREMMSLAGLPDRDYSMSFGIVTDAADLEKIHGYTARFMNDTGRDSWTFYPESRMVHCRRNVDSNIKRGISDFFAVYEQLIDAGKLLRNTARGHAIMSAIAFIREHGTGVSQSAVESMRGSGAWANYTQVTRTEGSRSRYTHHYQPGTIVDVPAGQKYQPGPMSGQGVGLAAVTVENAILRVAGTKWAMPSYMITGETDGNYASTLVTESPFVKFCQRQQKWHKEHFVNLLWKVLKIAHAAGRIGSGVTFDDLQRLLNIKVDCPIVHSRDRNVETNRRKVLRDAGLLSLPTWAAEEGYDFAKEKALGAEPLAVEQEQPVGDQPGAPVEKETHPQDQTGEQPFRGRAQPAMAKYESAKEYTSHARLLEAARLLWSEDA